MPIVNNLLTGFSNNLPGLKDYQHASRLYLDNNYRLSPKNKFLFYVYFNLDRDIPAGPTGSGGGAAYPANSNTELGMLVKSCQLPKFNMGYEEKIQYNKKAYVATRIQYQPINMVFHDDSADTVTAFWKSYYEYNNADTVSAGGAVLNNTPTATRDNMYDSGQITTQYGMDNAKIRKRPFLRSVQIFSLHQKQFTSYILVNPVISAFSHDDHDQSDGSGTMTHSMTLMYEAVVYNTGTLKLNPLPGFATLHYDQEPSPLIGKGTASILGPGGIFAQGAGVLSDIANGNISASTVLGAINVYQNSKKVSAASIKEETTGLVLSGIKNFGQLAAGTSSNPIGNFSISTGTAAAATLVVAASAKALVDSGNTAKNSVINNSSPNTSAYLSPSESLQLISTNTAALNQVASFIYYQQIGSRNGLSIAQSNANYAALPAAAQTQYQNQAYGSITNLVTQGYIQINRSTNNVTTSTEINQL